MKTRLLIIIVIISAVAVSGFVTLWLNVNSNPAFPLGYPDISQNDTYCWTQWYMEPTDINNDALVISIKETIQGFGPHVDIPNRMIAVKQIDEETVVSVAGLWTDNKEQHNKLTNTIRKHIGNTEILHDGIELCT
jgi:hypothetical protein